MQDVIGNSGHVITSSNSLHKKLSFQGWEKCVEAFSQGKGHLSHRCSQLMSQEDVSRLDVTISWSSSDDDLDDDSTQTRRRPSRLLSSQINFDECKPVCRGGRKHSSAHFIRSIEKRSKKLSHKETVNLECDPCPDNKEVLHSNLCGNSGLQFTKELSTNNTESSEEDIWIRNLSLLNQRVNLSSDCSESIISSDHLPGDSGTVISEDTGSQEIQVTSPILNSRQIKRKRSSFLLKAEIIPEEPTAPDSVERSPIFKTNISRRRSGHTSSKTSSNPELSMLYNDSKGSFCSVSNSSDILNCDDASKEVSNFFNNKACGAARTNDSMKSPKVLNKILETAVSPIISKSAKRGRLPAMVVDEDLSPIIGSKSKSHPSRIHKATPCALTLCNVSMEREGTNVSFKPGAIVSKHQNPFKSPVSNSKMTEQETLDKSKLHLTQNKTSAKRTLDFSVISSLIETKETKDFDMKEIVALEEPSRNGENKEPKNEIMSDKNNASHCEVESPAGIELQEKNKFLNHSCLIEEAYSEQLDFSDSHTKPSKSPVHLHMKKQPKLSLCKKSPRRIYLANKLACTSHIADQNISCNVPQMSSFETAVFPKEKTILVFPEVEDPLIKLPAQNKGLVNHSLFITEEFSESIEVPSQSVVTFPPSPPTKSPQTCSNESGCSIERVLVQELSNETNRKKYDDLDIDSCSSQSPAQSLCTQIEKLPSSGVSSPITISQSSSPPAPIGVVTSLIETIADDFNAPPRKGKKNFKPDGLANRLQRLLSRERSSSRLWQYKRSKQNKITTTAVNSDSKSSMLLNVEKTWIEYSHVIVQGYVYHDAAMQDVSRCLDALSNTVVLVLDPYVAEKLGKIMSASKLRIFPPWQGLKLKEVSLILCVFCIEVVPSSKFALENLLQAEMTEVSVPFKEGCESLLGLSFPDIIFPKSVDKPTCLFQFTEAVEEEESNASLQNPPSLGTISTLVSTHYICSTVTDSLKLTILRAFQFCEPVADIKGNSSPVWSVLGQDVTCEVCEVVLGCEPPTSSGSCIWQDLKTGQVIGKSYSFSGFLPIQRISPFRVSNLWRVVASMDVSGPCEQPVLYVLASANVLWECQPIEENKINMYQPQFQSLSSILHEQPRRVNVYCRLLHSTGERLYITDMDTSPKITVITINPTTYVAPGISKALVLAILDLDVVSVDDLRADKYTRICNSNDKDSSFFEIFSNEEQFNCLRSLNPTLPILDKNTSAKTLAMFYGTIVGVDEDSAYMWPACGMCQNELLSLGENSERYSCEKCNDQCENFILCMSLQVLCTCPNLPLKSSIRLKLFQSTIETLLPPTLCGEEGYDMNAVLGRKLGPFKCEVLHSKDGNFTLQELSS